MNKAEKWDKNADSFQKVFLGGENDYNGRLTAFLTQLASLEPGDKVIDIGCGVGKYGKILGRLGCDVTLSDISPRMLEFAAENMAEIKTPWRTLLLDFETAEPSGIGEYKLAMSTMCPAVHDLETVKKFSAISRGYCFLSMFYDWQQPARDEMFRLAGLEPRGLHGDMKAECEAIVSFVREAGFEPQVRYESYCWSDERSPYDAAEYILNRYFEPQEHLPELKARLLSAAERLSKDGVISDGVDTVVAWIYWTV